MRSPQRRRSLAKNRARGFTLLELLTVIMITLIVASISFISMQPVLKQQHVTNGYNTVLSAMRQARDNSIAQRTSYKVTLNAAAVPNTITVEPTFAGFQGVQAAVTYQLPRDVFFDNEPGIPNTPTGTPDGFGIGANAIDFGYTGQGAGGGKNIIYFCPDGSAQDGAGGAGLCAGNVDNGVVYIARRNELSSSRAISVWGATGRMRGWRLNINGAGGPTWQRQ